MTSFAAVPAPNAHISSTLDHIEDVVGTTKWADLEPDLLKFNDIHKACWAALEADAAAAWEAVRALYIADC